MKMTKILALGLVVSAYTLSGSVASAAADGAKLFKRKCAACHSIEAGKDKIGPSLHNVIGRKAGSYAFTRYRALKGADFVWDEDNLSEWIENPRKFIGKSTSMSVHVKKEADRKAIIAYLKAN